MVTDALHCNGTLLHFSMAMIGHEYDFCTAIRQENNAISAINGAWKRYEAKVLGKGTKKRTRQQQGPVSVEMVPILLHYFGNKPMHLYQIVKRELPQIMSMGAGGGGRGSASSSSPSSQPVRRSKRLATAAASSSSRGEISSKKTKK